MVAWLESPVLYLGATTINQTPNSPDSHLIIGIGTWGMCPPPKFSVCATPTLYVLYYKYKLCTPNQKVFSTPLLIPGDCQLFHFSLITSNCKFNCSYKAYIDENCESVETCNEYMRHSMMFTITSLIVCAHAMSHSMVHTSTSHAHKKNMCQIARCA